MDFRYACWYYNFFKLFCFFFILMNLFCIFTLLKDDFVISTHRQNNKFYQHTTLNDLILIQSQAHILRTENEHITESHNTRINEKRNVDVASKDGRDYYKQMPTADLLNKMTMSNNLKMKVTKSIKMELPNKAEESNILTNEDIESFNVWPESNQPYDDRILEQIRLAYHLSNKLGNADPKIINLYSGFPEDPIVMSDEGRTYFKDCPLSCKVEWNRQNKHLEAADAIMLMTSTGKLVLPSHNRSPDQVWIFYNLEPAWVANKLKYTLAGPIINWTMTYYQHSTISIPYGKYVKFSDSEKYTFLRPQIQEHLYNTYKENSKTIAKNRQAAVFMSNCFSLNNRLEYIRELQLFIGVDVFGHCGNMSCSKLRQSECSELLKKHYRFYLAFENSNCQQYITEKFFENALRNRVIPVVMGGRRDYYVQMAPPNSFIHVKDFKNPESLAKYLIKIDENEELFQSYFAWHEEGMLINTLSWCRLCAMLHVKQYYPEHHYDSIDKWWRFAGYCEKHKISRTHKNVTFLKE